MEKGLWYDPGGGGGETDGGGGGPEVGCRVEGEGGGSGLGDV